MYSENKTFTYIIRAIKALLYFIIILGIIITVYVLLDSNMKFDMVFSEENGMFRPNSLPRMALFFTLIAAIYPIFYYDKRNIIIGGSYNEKRTIINSSFELRDYILVEEDKNYAIFRKRTFATRLMRMFEDKIIVTKSDGTIQISGYRKDTVRLVSIIEHKCNQE